MSWLTRKLIQIGTPGWRTGLYEPKPVKAWGFDLVSICKMACEIFVAVSIFDAICHNQWDRATFWMVLAIWKGK